MMSSDLLAVQTTNIWTISRSNQRRIANSFWTELASQVADGAVLLMLFLPPSQRSLCGYAAAAAGCLYVRRFMFCDKTRDIDAIWRHVFNYDFLLSEWPKQTLVVDETHPSSITHALNAQLFVLVLSFINTVLYMVGNLCWRYYCG